MVHLSRFKLIFFALLIQFNIQLICRDIEDKGFEIFSLSYDENSNLKMNFLAASVYDKEAQKKEAEDIKNFNAETEITNKEIDKVNQENNALAQKIAKAPQQTKKIELEIKKTEQEQRKVENNKRLKTARLKKALEKL